MYKHILIATDGSELGSLSVDHGIALAASIKARVTIVNVTERWSALRPNRLKAASRKRSS